MSQDRELVMLDFDGVVADSIDVFSAVFIDACRKEGITGMATPADVLVLFEHDLNEDLHARGADDGQIAGALARTGEALVRAGHWLKPFPLLAEVLEELGQARTVIVVATFRPSAVVEDWLRKHGIAGVSDIVGVEVPDAQAAREGPGRIRALIDRYPGQDVYWFVGGAAGSLREARLAGATPLGVAWGWHDPERLRLAGAEHVAATPIELLTIVAPELVGDFFGA